MAPKKKGKKKGGKKKDKKEEDDAGKPKEAISELDKHYYLNQIQALEVKLKRSTTRGDQLDDAEKHARAQYDKLHSDKTDIIAFLKDRLSSKSDEVEELRNRLSGLVKSKLAEQQEYEARLSRLGKEAENTRLDLNDKIIALTRKLESLEEFRQHKEELEAKLLALEHQLEDCKEKHQEKVSFLEKAALVEAAALRAELEARVSRITEDLRRAAQTEVHSTTRRALHENEALTKQLEVFREKLGALRSENQDLREALSDSQVREGLLQDTVSRVTARGERRARLLEALTERAENHTHVWKDYDRLARENQSLRRDLQVMQGQVDAMTQATCDLREKAAEKDTALELTTTHLHQEDGVRRALQEALSGALSLLHRAAFMEGGETGEDNMAGILQQLVSLLSSAEAAHHGRGVVGEAPAGEGAAPVGAAAPPVGVGAAPVGGPRQVKYRAGDLGLLPRPHRKHKPTPDT
ncbi:cilia- and flagella-associated protein 157-like [Procambarus clarkii]|uniref:cilia- and flagella-associated protein 157-like n=1 Tax=Procambarus clarkii TaxID=6728 RepID=UPI001E67381B|nr:cilia- and flagella-associated protein 157-like [Procambarus clarkii]